MKKLMLLAIAALSVSAAQAVTVQWDDGTTEGWTGDLNLGTAVSTTSKSSGDTSGTVITNVGLSSTTAWTVLCNISISGFDGSFDTSGNRYPTIFGIATTQGGMATTYETIRFSSSNTTGLVTVAGVSGVSGSVQIPTDGSTLDLQLVVSYDGNGTLTFVVNGSVWGSATVDTSTLSNYSALVVGQQNANNQTNQVLSLETAYTSEVYVVTGSTIYDIVPEPTCLALLALGVAGLALRRRA